MSFMLLTNLKIYKNKESDSMLFHRGHFYALLLSVILTILTSMHANTVTLSGATSYGLPSGSSTPYSVAFSPNGSYLAVANDGSASVTIFQVGAGILSRWYIFCVAFRFHKSFFGSILA